jgi:cAMP-dependent protein kinase regulator
MNVRIFIISEERKKKAEAERENSDSESSDEEENTVSDLQIIKRRQMLTGKKQSRIAISE